MTFGQRLTSLRKEFGYNTRNEFAEKLGIPNTTLRNYETDVREPGHKFLKQISEMFNISVDYLLCLTDEKEVLNSFRLKTSETKIIEKYRFISEHSPLGAREVTACLDREYSIAEQLLAKDSRISELEATWDKKIRFIQYYQRLASAGTGQIVFDTPPTELIEIPDLPKYKYVKYAIGVNGDSMEPKYHDGDILLIEPTEEIGIGEVGMFIVDNEAYVKELGAKELISLNHDYPNIQLTEYSKCMGRVIDKLEDKIK